MLVFKNRTASKVARKIKTFLDSDTGFITRTAPGRRAWQRIVDRDGKIGALRSLVTSAWRRALAGSL